MKYLIISTNAIGDTYLSASAVQVIKKMDTNAEINFVSDSKCLPILETLSLNRIFITQKNFISLFTTILQIRENNYDFVFSFFPGLVNTFLLLLSKGEKKSGFINFIRWQEWYNRKQHVFTKGAGKQKLIWAPSDNYLKRIKLALSVFFDVTQSKCFEKKIMEAPPVNSNYSDAMLIHPFSRSKERTLSYDCINKMIDRYGTKNKVFVIGQSQDFLDFNDKEIPKLVDLKFLELVEAITSCKLFLAVDSFPLHIADAYNSNFIGLFGPTNPETVLMNDTKAIRFTTMRMDELPVEILIQEIDTKLDQLASKKYL